MAKKKLHYSAVQSVLPENNVIIQVARKSTRSQSIFTSFEECLNYLANTNSEIIPKDTVYGFKPRAAISMLLVSPKFNKEFTVTVSEVKYSNK